MQFDTEAPAMLSQWWRSDSCARAYERANKAKAERIAKCRDAFNARQEQLKRDVETWSEVNP